MAGRRGVPGRVRALHQQGAASVHPSCHRKQGGEATPSGASQAVAALWRAARAAHSRRAGARLVHAVGGVLLNVTHPVPDVGERGVIGDVIHQQDAHRAAVVCCARLPVSDTAHGSVGCGSAAGGAPLVMVRKRSCPAVSQICSFTHLFSSRIFFILKSMLRAGRAQHHAQPQGLQGTSHRSTSAAPPRAPDSGDEAGCERVLAEAQQQAALPHACAPRQGRPPSLDHRGRSTMAPRRRRPPNSAQTPAAPGRTAVANEQQLDEVVIVLPARGHLPGRPPRAAAHCITLRRKACPRCLPTLRSGPGQPPCTRAALENTSFDRFVQGLGL